MVATRIHAINRIERSDVNSISRLDVDSLLNSHTGNRKLFETLNKITDSDGLMCLLGQYIHFNSVFAAGAANLAGEIGVRQDLFRDSTEDLEVIADRSIEVAAAVFFAAIDEFGHPGTFHQRTHRSLAQATLKGVSNYFGYMPSVLNTLVRPSESTIAAIREVCNGYGLNQALDERNLFSALGFHMASEVLADEEFRILHSYLEAKQTDLVAYLKETEVLINGTGYSSYLWIHVHTNVETSHFDKALVGANQAVTYYTRQQSRPDARRWIVEGFKEFAAVQAAFMEALRN